MQVVPYLKQSVEWPQSGRHILAQYDETSIYVYQAYRPPIARFAVDEQRFGGEFSYSRMSWIKPNFLWMMYRSGWATKEHQECILAIRLRRSFFDELLNSAIASSFDPDRHASREQWQRAVSQSDVRLQWDPDHDPTGRPLARRAIQLGLRGESLRRFGERDLLGVEDITAFVAEQRAHLSNSLDALLVPAERVYSPADRAATIAAGIGQV